MAALGIERDPASESGRKIVHRTRGRRHGPLTRLISPDNLANALKPFVLLDLFQKDGAQSRFGLHPHSGLATMTYVAEGRASYTDPSGETGILTSGSLEWMKAGRGMWHAGGSEAGAMLGVQLWIALPPELELSPYESLYIAAETIERDGPARVLLGRYGEADSKVAIDLPINYLAVKLAAGERWSYAPPAGHSVLWLAVAKGALASPEPIGDGELVVFDDADKALVISAEADSVFVIGSAAPHGHELVLGPYSVHTSRDALLEGERHIERLGAELREQGRL